MSRLLVGTLCLLLATYASANESVAAVQKVIAMLGDMASKAKKEMNDEQVQFAEFQTWCGTEQSKLTNQIQSEAETIESLGADIGQLTAEAEQLGKDIAELSANIDQYEADIKSNTEQREKDNAAFQAESQDYSESISALERAIAVMQKQSYDRKGASAALLQLSASNQLPEDAKTMVGAFMSMMSDSDNSGDFSPEANAYEFQSTSIVDLLKKLLSEFTDKLGQCQKEEMNSKHAFDMIVQDLKNSLANAQEDKSDKTIVKAQKQSDAAKAKKDLAATAALKADDEKSLAETKTECEQKKLSFDEKQQLRVEEIQAIEKAIEILSSDDVSGAAENHLALAQGKKKGSALAQIRGASAANSEGIRHKLRDFLNSESDRLHSKNLALLAQKMSADPFAKVKKLIDDMITRLLNEANADADHEGFCDKEMGESKITREKLTKDIDGLTAAIEEGKAEIARLTQEIAELTQAVADLVASMKEATELRTAEKEKNAQTVEDATAAISAVEAAMAILKDFYAKSSQATGFMQISSSSDPEYAAYGTNERVRMGGDNWDALANPNFEGVVDKGHQEGMQTFGATYKGMQDEAGGVVAMLEVILSDFSTLKADTEAAETVSAKSYTDFMRTSEKDKAAKEKSIEMDNTDKAEAESKLQDDTADLKLTQDKLLAADRYYEKLVPQCIDKGMTFEERTKARESEIASLKQALTILEGEDIETSAL